MCPENPKKFASQWRNNFAKRLTDCRVQKGQGEEVGREREREGLNEMNANDSFAIVIKLLTAARHESRQAKICKLPVSNKLEVLRADFIFMGLWRDSFGVC